MAEDPATTAGALAVAGLLAESAATTRRDARNQDVVADLKVGDGRAGLDNGADRLMAEDGAYLHLRHVALEDMQVGTANRGRVDLDDGVGRQLDGRVGDRVPGALPGTVINECSHVDFLSCLRKDWAGVTSPISSLFLTAASFECRRASGFRDSSTRSASRAAGFRRP